MTTRLAIWLGIELVLAALLSASVCIERRAETRAYFEWRDTGTAAARDRLEQERAVTFRHHVVLALVLWCGMAVITVPAVVTRNRSRATPAGET